jgi:proteasome-associated ATPase
VARAAGKRCLFANVKPSQFESPYVGETQRNIREFFQVLRRRAKDALVVVFFDEVEGIGRIRGSHSGHHSDKFLAALLAEIEGFEGRSDLVLMAATNRKDLLDPALCQRLSEIEVEIRRPNHDGAREILGIHFPDTLPFSPNGAQAPATRQELIDAAVSQLYAPNGENEIVRIRFQDAKERTVRAAELVSGRILEQISKDARTRALRRETAGGEGGVCLADVNGAVASAMEKMRTMVTLHSAHAYLPDLPQDVTVVSVEPVRRAQQEAHRYLLS